MRLPQLSPTYTHMNTYKVFFLFSVVMKLWDLLSSHLVYLSRHLFNQIGRKCEKNDLLTIFPSLSSSPPPSLSFTKRIYLNVQFSPTAFFEFVFDLFDRPISFRYNSMANLMFCRYLLIKK